MAESFTYYFSTTDLYDTTITNGSDQVYYWLETERSGFLGRHRTTHIYRASPNGRELVFVIEYGTGIEGLNGKILFTLQRSTSTIREVFPKHALAPRHRDMPTPMGEFNWSRAGVFSAEVVLTDPSKNVVVQYDTNLHLFEHSVPTLVVSGTALSLPLDMIVLGVTVMRHDREQPLGVRPSRAFDLPVGEAIIKALRIASFGACDVHSTMIIENDEW
ncbi:hypothetical protein DL93DRAFT_2096690 [Clavulina sp. PMI_390]|nr:hypothetical protein DL93DRAFT_2096690 [Clavulina sp. PMI_390]